MSTGASPPFFLHLATKYLQQAFALFDEKTGIRVDAPLAAYDVLEIRFEEFADKEEDVKTKGMFPSRIGDGTRTPLFP